MRRGDKVDFHRGVYNHVGIADGKGGLFHFSGEPNQKTGAVYRYDRLKDVAGSDMVRINNTEDRRHKPLPPKQIVKRAKKKVGTGEGTYDLFQNNCEHKATEVRYDKPQSEQIMTLGNVAIGVGVSALLIGGLCALLSDNTKDSDEEEEE